jgi:RNA polymerase sigma factor FliA
VNRVECYEHIEQTDDLTAFVEEHASLINKLAWHIKSRLPSHIEIDDLIQSGLIGLLEAKSSFAAEKGAAFTTYASLKIRCAMYEFVRRQAGITRDISQNIKKMSAAIARIENKDDGLYSDKAVAEEMGISLKKYSEITREITTYQSIHRQDDSIEEIADDDTNNPLHAIEIDSEKSWIKSIISSFSSREQLILALYYNEQLSLKEIADITDLTEARISQIHSTLLSKLKHKLTYQNKAHS